MDKNHLLINLSESEHTSYGKEPFAHQSLPQRVFSAIWDVEAEVNNGGFSQYFQNSSCETAAFVVEALDIIGAPHAADICRRAIACAFPTGLPRMPEGISSTAADLPDAILDELEPLNVEFFSYPDDLTGLLFAYVSKYPDEFGELPRPDDG